MVTCVNPDCSQPNNVNGNSYCQCCGSGLLLSGRYSAIQQIGAGGFSRTFLAKEIHHESDKYLIKQFYIEPSSVNTTKSVKPINLNASTVVFGLQGLPDLEDMRRKEIDALRRLKHPQIPKYIDEFSQDNFFYIVQEFVDGITLSQEAQKYGIFSEEQIVIVLHEILEILVFVHAQKIIHRDIKPENIIRSSVDKKLVLVDFGAAKLVSLSQNNSGNIQSTTQNPATFIGTNNYISPEQSKGRPTYASDLYSLGTTCISLLSGRSPNELFNDSSHSWEWQAYCKISNEKLIAIINKLVEFGTLKRYQTPQEVLEDLNSKKEVQEVKGISSAPDNKAKSWRESLGSFAVAHLPTWINSFGVFGAGLAALLTVAVSIGIISRNSASDSSIPTSGVIGTFDGLKTKLKNKEWKQADLETYEVLLSLAGKTAQSKGFLSSADWGKISCSEISKIDSVWREFTGGKQGFSAQQSIYDKSGQDWKKTYIALGWTTVNNSSVVKNIDQEFDWESRRFKYLKGKEPKYDNLTPGHLPVTMKLVQGIAFPQISKVCK
jgi:serine/threonine protein kinase